jgi:hypothetical protein
MWTITVFVDPTQGGRRERAAAYSAEAARFDAVCAWSCSRALRRSPDAPHLLQRQTPSSIRHDPGQARRVQLIKFAGEKTRIHTV